MERRIRTANWYVTHDKEVSMSKWRALYQNNRGVYATDDDKHGETVIDRIPTEEEDWFVYYNVMIQVNDILTKKIR